jgi:biopolymer transport protein ExbB
VTQLLQLLRPAIIALALIGTSMTVTSHAASARTAEKAPAAEKVETKSLLDLYHKGGWVMHAIALSSLGVIAVIAFCATRIRRVTMIPVKLQSSLDQALSNQDVVGALRICDDDASSLSHVIKETLTKAGAGVEFYSKSDLEAAAAETIFHEETRYMLWVNMLNAFAAVAPMMGLLGTVSGMIGSFDQLAAGASKPSDFAGGIGEAMITTAAALIVAIPSMMAYFVFKNMLQSLVGQLAHSTSTLINRFVSGPAISGPHRAQA